MDEQEVKDLKQKLAKMLDNKLLMANRRLQQSLSTLTKADALVKAGEVVQSNPVLKNALADPNNCAYTMLGNLNSTTNPVQNEIRQNANRKFSGVAPVEDCEKVVGILLAL